MMNRIHPVPSKTQWPVHWLMVYGNENFVAKGTVLEVAAKEWRAEGPMPVHPGMRLNIWIYPPEQPEGLHVEAATVLWVKDYEFALDVQNLGPIAYQWLTQRLDPAVGLRLVSRAA